MFTMCKVAAGRGHIIIILILLSTFYQLLTETGTLQNTDRKTVFGEAMCLTTLVHNVDVWPVGADVVERLIGYASDQCTEASFESCPAVNIA